jgi:hypothetical protein
MKNHSILGFLAILCLAALACGESAETPEPTKDVVHPIPNNQISPMGDRTLAKCTPLLNTDSFSG